MRRHRKPATRPKRTPTLPLHLEVIERHVFAVIDAELAATIRQALAAEDFERLDELIGALHAHGGPDTTTLEANEVSE